MFIKKDLGIPFNHIETLDTYQIMRFEFFNKKKFFFVKTK